MCRNDCNLTGDWLATLPTTNGNCVKCASWNYDGACSSPLVPSSIHLIFPLARPSAWVVYTQGQSKKSRTRKHHTAYIPPSTRLSYPKAQSKAVLPLSKIERSNRRKKFSKTTYPTQGGSSFRFSKVQRSLERTTKPALAFFLGS